MNQDEHHQLLLSPALSTASSTLPSSQPCFTAKSLLFAHGISNERADELITQYNRQSIPIMSDEKFFHKLNEIAIDKNSGLEDIETSFRAFLTQESARLSEDAETAKDKFLMSSLDFFQSESQSFLFATSLSEHTVHGFGAFVAYCLPHLIEMAGRKNDETNRQRPYRSPKVRERNRQRAKSAASKPSSQVTGERNPRRSARLSGNPTRRSRRIRGQKPLAVAE
ncbi:MAG: hypothetical protein Q9217_005936 [Psora testacea]